MNVKDELIGTYVNEFEIIGRDLEKEAIQKAKGYNQLYYICRLHNKKFAFLEYGYNIPAKALTSHEWVPFFALNRLRCRIRNQLYGQSTSIILLVSRLIPFFLCPLSSFINIFIGIFVQNFRVLSQIFTILYKKGNSTKRFVLNMIEVCIFV